MTWTCPSCGTCWPTNPFVEGTIGCPECGSVAELAGRVRDRLDQGERDSRLLDARDFKVRPWNAARKELDALLARLSAAETERDEAREIVEQLRRHGADWVVEKLKVAVARAEAAEEEVARYRKSLMAHHELSTLSEAAIAESIGGTCQICARAHAAGQEETT